MSEWAERMDPIGSAVIAGSAPAFPEGLPLARPSVEDPDAVAEDIRRILKSGILTNGPYVRDLERRVAEYLGVSHCVAVASCTTGLMLALRAMELSGDAVVPSFTFSATAHAVAWNGLRPVFADVDPETLTLSPDAAHHAAGVRTAAVVATHTFGTPCDVEALASLARRNGLRLLFDAAHAFGSTRGGTYIGGFGDAEVFSLSPTKPLIAGEGGLITTNDDVLAERCRIGRDYGNPGDYDCRFVGLNARMSEVHAAIALSSLDDIEERILERNVLADRYRTLLAQIPGLSFPTVRVGDRSTYKDFTVLVDSDEFGIGAPELAAALAAEGIDVRRYYAPPVHSQRAYEHLARSNGHLPVTDSAAARVVTLPLWCGMTEAQQAGVADAINRIRRANPSGSERRKNTANRR
jgi:dTDP-4-amino-4,6-dideoxygalactose transaminase